MDARELEKRIAKLEQDVASLRSVRNIEFIEEMKRRFSFSISVESGASLTGTTIAVRNASDTGSEVVADDYTGALTLTDGDGNTYKIGYY